ncbi:ABC transporter ATP-binding protein [Streptomyces sp. E11-3]|uniref:ABC transporter transmembrane domain-containing protein n=1 Tax=Streptomyces sp. E11-3 TaxID=3110112 RepID=UPI0039802731
MANSPEKHGTSALRAAARHSAVRCTALALLSTAAAAASLLLPAALGRALDLLLAPSGDGGGGDTDAATRWVLLCTALLCVLALLDAVDAVLTGTTNARTTVWLRGKLVHHLLAVGPRATTRFAPGDLVARLIGNASAAGTAPTTIAALLAALVLPLGAMTALWLIDPWLAVVFIAGAPLLALLLRAFARASSDCSARYQRIQGDIAGRLTEAINGSRTIAAAHTADKETARILRPLPELALQGHRMWRVQGRAAAQAAALAPLLQIGVLAVAGHLLAQGRLSVGELLAASRYVALATGIGVFVGRLASLVRARTASHRLGEVLTEPATEYGTRPLPPRTQGSGRLELRGVRARRGGPDLDPTPTRERVTQAARTACADTFVRRLPEGYDTPCADAPLSGGEAQRLGLARAFAHPGRLLILDDALSSLDTVTEHQITQALLRHTPTASRLIVAHRASTAARADAVAWLDGGRIRAVGPHERLWRDPEYRAVFDAAGRSET